jgi:hypothetical protein
LRVARLVGAIALAFLLVAAVVIVRAQDDGCPDPWVMYEEVCTIPNELVVMTNDDQDRSDLEAAVAPLSGKVVFEVDGAGIYSVRFPVAGPAEMAPFIEVLESAGFTVGYSYMVELFAGL